MSKRIKSKTRESALPRRRSAAALSLQSPLHRQRVIPDKRRAANERAANEETRAVALGLEPLGRIPHKFYPNLRNVEPERSLADDLQLEGAALNRLVIAATTPKRPLSLDEARQLSARMTNTLCPKIGAAQWTCTRDECTCHLKESIPVPAARAGAAIACATTTRRPSYDEAVKHRPRGACYCDLDDRACYAAGHWEPACSWDNGPCRTVRCTDCPLYSNGLRN